MRERFLLLLIALFLAACGRGNDAPTVVLPSTPIATEEGAHATEQERSRWRGACRRRRRYARTLSPTHI